MKLSVPTLLIAGLGSLLIWSGVTNRNPVHVIKAILTGQPIPAAGGVLGSAVGSAGAEAGKAGAAKVKPA